VDRCAANVTRPTVTAYLPDVSTATGTGVLIMPGGGYGRVCIGHEGEDIARRLNRDGIAGFVLKYRVPNGHEEIPLRDAQQALKLVRANADQWRVDPERIGVMGFSAGGHLASTVGTHFNEDIAAGELGIAGQSVRPDFVVLVYPVVTLLDPFAHTGSRTNLLGDDPPESLVKRFSNELHVTPETPPTFLVHSVDDRGVPIENSLLFFNALRANDVPVEFHAFEVGGHGFGLGRDSAPCEAWPELLVNWLRNSGFLDGSN
jgi:acetyl esterase/lipase